MVRVICKTHERVFSCAECIADPAAVCECLLDARDYERELIRTGHRTAHIVSATGSLLSSRSSSLVSELAPGTTALAIMRKLNGERRAA